MINKINCLGSTPESLTKKKMKLFSLMWNFGRLVTAEFNNLQKTHFQRSKKHISEHSTHKAYFLKPELI